VSAKKKNRIGFELFLILLIIVQFFPLYVVIVNILKPKTELTSIIKWPQKLTLDNINYIINSTSFLHSLWNSVFTTVISICILVFLGSMAAYPLARMKTKIASLLSGYFLLGLMLPMQFAMIPLFQVMKLLGLMDSYTGLILVEVAYNLPLSIFIFMSFIRTIPLELEQAAYIDGCNKFQTFFKVVFPLIKPAVVVVIISDLLVIWNDFLSPLLFISDSNKHTLPVMVLAFQGQYGADVTSMFTAVALASLPLVIVFLFLQKYFYKGITAGAIK
jgi:raffinose/stachyose/melibiose transport system permease protein